MHRLLPALLIALVLSACTGREPPRATPATPTQAEAMVRIGDVTVRATAVPTATLSPEVAARYGIARDDRTVLLLVGVRQGPEGNETALPATITATATNLGGQRQDVAMRELRTDGLLDYIGIVETTPPDTLRFDVTIVRDGATSSMQFSREFHPR